MLKEIIGKRYQIREKIKEGKSNIIYKGWDEEEKREKGKGTELFYTLTE